METNDTICSGGGQYIRCDMETDRGHFVHVQHGTWIKTDQLNCLQQNFYAKTSLSLKENVLWNIFPLYVPATRSLVRPVGSYSRSWNTVAYKSHASKAYLNFDKSSVFQSVSPKKCQHILCILADMNSLSCKWKSTILEVFKKVKRSKLLVI